MVLLYIQETFHCHIHYIMYVEYILEISEKQSVLLNTDSREAQLWNSM